MENITLEQISLAVAFMVALITGSAFLLRSLKTLMRQLLKEQLDAIDARLDALGNKIDEVDMESCKNFLVKVISDVMQGNPIDEIGRERFWEEYQHYTKNGGNSYIKHKVEKMTSEGKL